MKKILTGVVLAFLVWGLIGCGKTADSDGGGGGGGGSYQPSDTILIQVTLFDITPADPKPHADHWGTVNITEVVTEGTPAEYHPVQVMDSTVATPTKGSFSKNVKLYWYDIPVGTTVNIAYTNTNGSPTNIVYTTGPGRGTLGSDDLVSGIKVKTTPHDDSSDQFNIFVGWGPDAGKIDIGSNPKFIWEPI
ncbi:MAG: hypothetical protein LBK68_06700 [Candidatus Margulisbacteria bacterium]|jgi:hypothetical protein|nr:hypothetical protein [Candidatus Margulisiibacteriota bacterium]